MPATVDQIKQTYPGYAGWNDPNAIIGDYNATGGAGKGGTPFALGKGIAWQPATTPTPTPTPTTPTAAPATAPAALQLPGTQTPAATTPTQPQSVQDLVSMGYTGYTGWPDAAALADFKATGGQGKGSPTNQTISGSVNSGQLNLVNLYDSLFKSAGIPEIETELAQKEQALADAKASINDNPFLSEATRVGRVAKLDQLYNDSVKAKQNELAMKKADIETRINLETKQFDINSQQTRDAWDKFNSLLSSGALNGATSADIANITRATGIPSAMIQASIKNATAKNVPTQVVSATDNNGNVTVALINTQTGEIIKKSTVGQVGKTSDSSVSIKTSFINDANNLQGQNVNGVWVGQFPLLVKKYAATMSLQDIYSLYMQSTLGQKYGQPTEDPNRIQQLYNMSRTGATSGVNYGT